MAAHHLKRRINLSRRLFANPQMGRQGQHRKITTEIVGDELCVLHHASENKLQITVHEDPPVENISRKEIL